MPNYTANYNGKTVTLTGDAPPTEKDFDAAFSQIDSQPQFTDSEMNTINAGKPIEATIEASPLADKLNNPASNFVHGLSEIPRAVGGFVGNQVLRPLVGKKPLPSQDLQQLYDNSLIAGQPAKTGIGKVAEFAGGLAPTLALPEANVFKGAGLASKIGNMGLTGAYQGGLIGGVGAQNNGQNPIEGIKQGALVGSAIGGGLPVAGQVFEKVAPTLGSIAGINKNSYTTLFDNMKNPTSNMPVNRALLDGVLGKKSAKTGEMVGNEIEKLKTMPDLNRDEINNLTQDTIDKYANGATINPTADAVKPDLKQIQKYLDEGNSQLIQLPNGQTMTSEEFTQFFPDMKPEEINGKVIDLGGIKPMNLQVIKQDLQDKLDFNPDNPTYTKQGSALLRDLQHQYKNKLEELSPELGEANKAHQIAKSAEQFKNLLPQGKYHKARIAAELGGIIPAVAGGMTHNPFLSSFGAISTLFSPLAHGIPMAGYEIGTKISPYLPRALTTGINQK